MVKVKVLQIKNTYCLIFAKKNKIKVYSIYSDDGESGAFYDRPEFMRMIDDIEAGHINMVVVKVVYKSKE